MIAPFTAAPAFVEEPPADELGRVVIPAPLPHQREALDAPQRFKLLRWGRRTAKSRCCLIGAVTGHGPDRKWRGMAQGGDIVWLCPDYPQARAIWREEIEPRFAGRRGVVLSQTERRVSFTAGGSLEIRSAEAVDGVRGRRLDGVVIDEAAHLDLESAWKEVILPALLDRTGWAMIASTPNAGPDGHETADGKRTPSYFNILCSRYAAGDLGPDWFHSHHTARDNPTISREGLAALLEEYPADSPEAAQEIEAKLIVGGSGLAFPELADDAHLATYAPEKHGRYAGWRWAAGGDWGYSKPGGLWLIATGPERSLVRHEFYFRQRTPYDVGYTWGKQIMRFPRPEWIAIDTPAVSDGGPTILEELQRGLIAALGRGLEAPPFINPPKGPGSRLTKKQLLHQALRYTRQQDGTIRPWDMPALQFHATDCPNLVRTLWSLPRDPKKPEDVDTTAEDHGYDGLGAWLMARTPQVERVSAGHRDPDVHPGWGERLERLPYHRDPFEDDAPSPRWQRMPDGVWA